MGVRLGHYFSRICNILWWVSQCAKEGAENKAIVSGHIQGLELMGCVCEKEKVKEILKNSGKCIGSCVGNTGVR